ncbi:hypothetical protein [Plantactinospora sp. GCM10030261]|uniref:hypothetical protein n=1 Tax=Plantactinospora sp. GCM10030261 TaxID=3273420 RepID=UPI00362260CF
MDVLDRVAGPGGDLLGRVDDLLTTLGAPEDHRIWPMLRRVGALPGAAAGWVAELRPATLSAAGQAVRAPLPTYEDVAASLLTDVDWAGAAADAARDRRVALAERLTGGPETLTGRLDGTARYAEELTDWARRARGGLGRTVVEALGSAEAVTVLTGETTGGEPNAALAAAEIGARVLACVADVLDGGVELLRRFGSELAESPTRPVAGGSGRFDDAFRALE